MQIKPSPWIEYTPNCMNVPYLRNRAIRYLHQHFFYLSSYMLIIEASRHLKRYFKKVHSLSINKPINVGLKPAYLAKKTSQFFSKTVKYLFYSWSDSEKPPFRLFSNLNDLFLYCPDPVTKVTPSNKKDKAKLIREIAIYQKLKTLVIKSTNLQVLRPLSRLNLSRLDVKFSFSDLMTSWEIMNKVAHPKTELNFSFFCDEILRRDIHNGLIMQSFKNTKSISIICQQDILDFLVFRVISINSFQMNSLKRISFNFAIRHPCEFPDLNFLEKMSNLQQLYFKIEINGKCDHEIFDMIKFPGSLKTLSLLFLKSNQLDLKDSNLSKDFFYSILKLAHLEDLELSFSENVPGIIRTKDIMTKNYFTYFIKRFWIFLPKKLTKLRLETPFLTESDDFFWRNLGIHKNIEALEINLNGEYPKYCHHYKGTIVLEKLKYIKIYETLFFLTFLSPSSFQKVENCTIIVMDKDPYLDFRQVIDIIMMMGSLVNLEMFYFAKQALTHHEAEGIVKMLQILKFLRDVKITTMNLLDEIGINMVKNELNLARRIHNATISFKNLTVKKYFAHTFIIQF